MFLTFFPRSDNSFRYAVPRFSGKGACLIILPVAALFALSPGLFAATTWYVAPTGNDSYSGGAAGPFATIQHAVDLAQPGDTVVVENGTYGPNGHYTCGTICSGKGFAAPVVFSNSNSGTAAAPITVTAQNKWGAILDCELPDGYSGNGTDGVKACDTYFNFVGAASYIIIRNFDIIRGYWNGAMVNGSNNHDIQFIGNHFHHIGNRYYTKRTGFERMNAVRGDGPGGVRSRSRIYSLVANYAIEGVYAGNQSSSITFEGNEFNNIGRLPNPGGILADDYIHDNGLDLGNGPYRIINNIFYANTAGFSIQISPGTHDVAIVNNTFAGTNPQYDGLIMLWASDALPNTNITIQNNIFYGARNYAITTAGAYEVATRIDHNLVYGSLSGVIDTAVVHGSYSVTNNVLNANPMFVNSATYNFHLQSGSPAIDKGAPVDVTTDFDGNPRPLGCCYDIGAYEYTGQNGGPPV